MTDDPRGTALVFLLGQHLLSRTEAEEALRVAENVLRDGLDRLNAATAAHNITACQEASHALKGSLLNLGLARLANLAQHLQETACHGQRDQCRSLARQLAAELTPFFTEG